MKLVKSDIYKITVFNNTKRICLKKFNSVLFEYEVIETLKIYCFI